MLHDKNNECKTVIYRKEQAISIIRFVNEVRIYMSSNSDVISHLAMLRARPFDKHIWNSWIFNLVPLQ